MEQAIKTQGRLLDTSKPVLVDVNGDACECLVLSQIQLTPFLISERLAIREREGPSEGFS